MILFFCYNLYTSTLSIRYKYVPVLIDSWITIQFSPFNSILHCGDGIWENPLDVPKHHFEKWIEIVRKLTVQNYSTSFDYTCGCECHRDSSAQLNRCVEVLNKLCKILHNPCETYEPTNSCVKSYTIPVV